MIRIGQIRKDRKRSPTSYAVVLSTYTKIYPSGDQAIRGMVQITTADGDINNLNWDARSIIKVWPFVHWPPEQEAKQ